MSDSIEWSPVFGGGALISLNAHEWFQIITTCRGITLLIIWREKYRAWESLAVCDSIVEAQAVAEVENTYLEMGIR